VGPLQAAAVASASIGPVDAPLPIRPDPSVDQATQPGPKGFTDQAARVSFDPPLGWIREPSDALNPQSDPADPAQELVRFQLRLDDPSLYTFPVPVPSPRVRTPGAVLTDSLAL